MAYLDTRPVLVSIHRLTTCGGGANPERLVMTAKEAGDIVLSAMTGGTAISVSVDGIQQVSQRYLDSQRPQEPPEPQEGLQAPVWWDVWSEGYRATGEAGHAYKVGSTRARTFTEACAKLCSSDKFQESHGSFDPHALTVWGCKLYPNEAQARATYG